MFESVGLLRILRIMRIIRLSRLLRKTRNLRELQKLVRMMATCLKALMWSFEAQAAFSKSSFCACDIPAYSCRLPASILAQGYGSSHLVTRPSGHVVATFVLPWHHPSRSSSRVWDLLDVWQKGCVWSKLEVTWIMPWFSLLVWNREQGR